MSPSKTFNLSGLSCGFAVIPNAELAAAVSNGCGGAGATAECAGIRRLSAAYEGGSLASALIILSSRQPGLAEAYFREQVPLLSVSHVEGTYLAWIDGASAWPTGCHAAVSIQRESVWSDGSSLSGRRFGAAELRLPAQMLKTP